MPKKITSNLVRTLITEQFPEFSHLPIQSVEKQGHDNRTYRLGSHMSVRLPTMEDYALAIEKEHKFLPLLAAHLTIKIPTPIKRGNPSSLFPFLFSIYQWLKGETLEQAQLNNSSLENIALELANFLKELQRVDTLNGPPPGQHNCWRGDHVSVYDKGAREQIAQLVDVIDADKAISLWEKACQTYWRKPPVWVHGDFAVGNILVSDKKLSAIIDFGVVA